MADYSRGDGGLGLFLDVDAFFFFFLMEFLAGVILLYPMYGYASITKWIIPELCSLRIHSSSQVLILASCYTSLYPSLQFSTP